MRKLMRRESGPWSTALYIRLSCEDERKRESGSVENQKQFLLHYIAGQPDLRLHSVYEDVQQTGADFQRPAFQRLMADIRRGSVNCVVVKDLSRFGRSFLESSEYLELVFPLLGVRFIAVNDRIDSIRQEESQAMGAAFRNLMNEMVLKDLSGRIKSSVASDMQHGHYRGTHPPYGYTVEKDARGKRRLAADPDTAPVVRQIFRWKAGGYGYKKIAGLLNRRGITPPRKRLLQLGLIRPGNQPVPDRWGESTVRQLIQNPLFLGEMVQHRRERPGISAKRLAAVRPEDWIRVPGTHEALVTPEEFRAANQTPDRPETDHFPPISPSLLGGLVFCHSCGGRMRRSSSLSKGRNRRIYRYRCPGDGAGTACPGRPVPEEAILRAAADTLSAHTALLRPRSPFLQQATRRKRTRSLRKTALRSLYEQLAEGRISEAEYLRQKAQIEAEQNGPDAELSSGPPLGLPADQSAFFHRLIQAVWVHDPQHLELELSYPSPFCRCFRKEDAPDG